MRTSSPLLLCVFIFGILSLVSAGDLQAQCTYKVVSLSNDTTSFTIPCDFPVKANTGDSAVDEDNFIIAFTSWNRNTEAIKHLLLPSLQTTGIKIVFFEITAAGYAAFTQERKNAIAAHAALYKILP